MIKINYYIRCNDKDTLKQKLKDRINTTKDFKSSLDIILELEQ